MGFFNWRKKKKAKKEENFPIMEENALTYDLDDKKNVQKYIMDCCEQIVELGKELKEDQDEYRVVTSYLNDIQVLENLPDGELREVRATAESVQSLNQKRAEYQNSEKRISDAQFMQMKQQEETIPSAIRRLQENEEYQNVVKRDMNYLEGEKTQWHYNKYELMHEQKLLKGFSFALVGIFLVCIVVLVVLQIGFSLDTTYAWMIVLFLTAISGFGVFLRMSSNQTKIQHSEVNMNHAIVLLNKVRFKYVNVTNAVDYAREKYHVKNAYEFNYLWEQYLNEVKEREKFEQANEDLEYFNAKLVRLLKQYRLYDASVWVNQSSALVDKKEMVEVKHNLIVRRQKLRARIEDHVRLIRERRRELDGVLKREKIDTPQVRQIINSIDQIDLG